jgi:PIN domain nuclease of toxin-antitoxin system
VIVLDTHVALWIGTNAALGRQSRKLVEQAFAEDGLAISAISFWEISLLIAKKRFITQKTATMLRTELLDTGVVELPLTGSIAIRAVELDNLHGDPADRFIAATAVVHDAILMTADRLLLKWRHKVVRQNASR